MYRGRQEGFPNPVPGEVLLFQDHDAMPLHSNQRCQRRSTGPPPATITSAYSTFLELTVSFSRPEYAICGKLIAYVIELQNPACSHESFLHCSLYV